MLRREHRASALYVYQRQTMKAVAITLLAFLLPSCGSQAEPAPRAAPAPDVSSEPVVPCSERILGQWEYSFRALGTEGYYESLSEADKSVSAQFLMQIVEFRQGEIIVWRKNDGEIIDLGDRQVKMDYPPVRRLYRLVSDGTNACSIRLSGELESRTLTYSKAGILTMAYGALRHSLSKLKIKEINR